MRRTTLKDVELETSQISVRTKAALEAYRACGGKLGAQRPECRNLTREARLKGAHNAGNTHRQQADEAYTEVWPIIWQLRCRGNSLQAIADKLNAQGLRTRRGRDWQPTQVLRVLRRAIDCTTLPPGK